MKLKHFFMTLSRISSKAASAAERYVQNEQGIDPVWFLYRGYPFSINGDTIKDLLKTGGHFIKKRKSMKHSELKFFPLRTREVV